MQQITLKNYCAGAPKLDNFELQACPKPSPEDGQFIVRHIYNSVDPGTRSRLSGGDSYAAALPLGTPIDGFSVGCVEDSKNADFPDGTKVYCAGGWRTHTLQNGRGFIGKIPQDIDLPLSLWIGILGVPGLTAWFGLKSVASFQSGDRALITSAGGPVGATAGQLARLWGASEIVGIAGSDDKGRWLIEQAGFDHFINYKTTPDLDAAIQQTMPDGIDILFDNVGNAMINRVLPMMRMHGRICVSGQVADYNVAADSRPGIVNTLPFITHRVRMQGLVVFDFIRAFEPALRDMARFISEGRLTYLEEKFDGIEKMPEAFCGLFRGDNMGRRVVKVGEEA